MAINYDVAALAPIWPGSTRALTVHDTDLGTLTIKIAQESEVLMIWLEDVVSRRQFYASLTNEDCVKIVEGTVEPCVLLDMLCHAISVGDKSGEEVSASFEQHGNVVTIRLVFQPSKWMTKTFLFPLSERNVTQLERLERRIEDVEAKWEVKFCEVKDADFTKWTLHVCNPYYAVQNEGAHGFFALNGNYFLTQDTDFRTKRTGVSTTASGPGFIQASFAEPLHVNQVKIAPFTGWGNIADNNTLSIQTLSPDTGIFETLKTNIPSSTKEEVFPVDKVILALRLSGTYVSISKLIFA